MMLRLDETIHCLPSTSASNAAVFRTIPPLENQNRRNAACDAASRHVRLSCKRFTRISEAESSSSTTSISLEHAASPKRRTSSCTTVLLDAAVRLRCSPFRWWRWLLGTVVVLSVIVQTATSQSVRRVYLGFPDAWDGDKHTALKCQANNIPKFLDGYFLCQLSASYGARSAPPGRRLTHMIDAIGAVGAFHISNGEVHFRAQYYPSRPFKIWEFYDRNLTKASVPWQGWSDYNVSAMTRWEQVPLNADSARFHPNLDFWRVGKRLVAGTEAPHWLGYEFDVPTLSNFKLFSFIEDNEIFGDPRSRLIPISMAIHERVDPRDGTIWGSFSAMNFKEQRFFQGIFTVDADGVRRVLGMYDYGVWDERACASNDEYIGDKTRLPGYIHSITSTEHYVIIPITSLLINPCKFKEPPMSGDGADPAIQAGGLWGMDFYDMVPMRFLVFNKRTRSWMTPKPLEVFPSMFITHQLNAYEIPAAAYSRRNAEPDENVDERLRNADGSEEPTTLISDMIVYDNHDPYVKYFYTDFLTTQLYPQTARVLRFTLDLHRHKVMYSYLTAEETLSADFPQVNHRFDDRPYEWTYMVEHPFAAANAILKVNVDAPNSKRNTRFRPIDGTQMVLHEPWFVARPAAIAEDDGVLLIRALDLLENKGLLLVVDAITMLEIGRAYAPISIPFGFHNRFFTSRSLGLTVDEKKERVVDEEAEDEEALEERARLTPPPPPPPPPPRRRFPRPRDKAHHHQFWSRRIRGGRMTTAATTTTVSSLAAYGRPLYWVHVRPYTVARGDISHTATSAMPPPPEPLAPVVPLSPFQPPVFPEPRGGFGMASLLGNYIDPTRREGPVPLPTVDASPSQHTDFRRIRPQPPGPQHPRSPYPTGKLTSLPFYPSQLLPHPPPAPITPDPMIEDVEDEKGGVATEFGGRERTTALANVGQLTLHEIYERTLRALCRWLPKIFRNMTIDGCVSGAERGAQSMLKWMAKNQGAQQRHDGWSSESDERPSGTLSQAVYPRLHPVSSRRKSASAAMPTIVLRPILRRRVAEFERTNTKEERLKRQQKVEEGEEEEPWYNYRLARANNARVWRAG